MQIRQFVLPQNAALQEEIIRDTADHISRAVECRMYKEKTFLVRCQEFWLVIPGPLTLTVQIHAAIDDSTYQVTHAEPLAGSAFWMNVATVSTIVSPTGVNATVQNMVLRYSTQADWIRLVASTTSASATSTWRLMAYFMGGDV